MKDINKLTLEDLALDHDYYCSDSNYYSNDASIKYDTFNSFLEEFGKSDLDYNLPFRFDIKKGENNYYMEIFLMLQRKGKFVPIMIDLVVEEDVPNIIKYLKKGYNKLNSLWNPINKLL